MPSWKMTKATWSIRLFALAKIPMIAILRPTMLVADGESCVVRFPFSWLAKNHLGSLLARHTLPTPGAEPADPRTGQERAARRGQ